MEQRNRWCLTLVTFLPPGMRYSFRKDHLFLLSFIEARRVIVVPFLPTHPRSSPPPTRRGFSFYGALRKEVFSRWSKISLLRGRISFFLSGSPTPMWMIDFLCEMFFEVGFLFLFSSVVPSRLPGILSPTALFSPFPFSHFEEAG